MKKEKYAERTKRSLVVKAGAFFSMGIASGYYCRKDIVEL